MTNPADGVEMDVQWDSLVSAMRLHGELTLATLLAVEAGELSEGRAVELLMIDRMTLREIRHTCIRQVTELAASCKLPFDLLLATILDKQKSSTKKKASSSSCGKGRKNGSSSRKKKS